MAELADAADSKSAGSNPVRVQVPSSLLIEKWCSYDFDGGMLSLYPSWEGLSYQWPPYVASGHGGRDPV